MEGITGWGFKEVWLKGKIELERDVIGHSQDFVIPLTPQPMHFDSSLALVLFTVPSTLTYRI